MDRKRSQRSRSDKPVIQKRQGVANRASQKLSRKAIVE